MATESPRVYAHQLGFASLLPQQRATQRPRGGHIRECSNRLRSKSTASVRRFQNVRPGLGLELPMQPLPRTLLSGSRYCISPRSSAKAIRRPSSTTARRVVPLLAASSLALIARSLAMSIVVFMKWTPVVKNIGHNIIVAVGGESTTGMCRFHARDSVNRLS